jgi:hypothetical protein
MNGAVFERCPIPSPSRIYVTAALLGLRHYRGALEDAAIDEARDASSIKRSSADSKSTSGLRTTQPAGHGKILVRWPPRSAPPPWPDRAGQAAPWIARSLQCRLRKVAAWPANLAVITPLGSDPQSTVRVSKANAATPVAPKRAALLFALCSLLFALCSLLFVLLQGGAFNPRRHFDPSHGAAITPTTAFIASPTRITALLEMRSRMKRGAKSAWPKNVAHHVAGDVGGGEFLAQFVQRSTIIVGDGNDVTHRPTHPWQLPLQHHRLAVADQEGESL